MSREYPDMCVDEHQLFGTLTGLTSGLLLSSLAVNNHKMERYPYRKLIVPFGELRSEKTFNIDHQTVIIQRSSSVSFLHQYFVFILNDRLKILQSIDSSTGWLYLAFLHTMTSHPLPDQYTGMTGMERAFQLLHSAGCWSDQPFDFLSLNILSQIADISPKVDYYPEHLTRMAKIDWNNNGIPYSMQHFGYYLIAKQLIETTQQLGFMYSSSICTKMPEIFENKLYNESLLKILYWNYRDSYNPIARLPTEIEENILCSLHATPYQTAPNYCSHAINHTIVRPIDDLYKKGNVNLKDCSRQHWLPLSQWLNDENNLKTTWIGLLKMIHNLKVTTILNNRDEIERCEKLINFLYYVSGKLKTKPFYFQMLKKALKMPAALMTIVTCPPFIEYSDIEEISVIRKRINLPSDYTSDIRNRIIAEIEHSWQNNCYYEDKSKLTTSSERLQVNKLLTSWGNNRKLRSFLESIQNLLCSAPIEQFCTNILYNPQKFAGESVEEHYQLQVKWTNKLIDKKLLESAFRKFYFPNTGHFNKSKISSQTANKRVTFPNHIFPSVNHKETTLSEIGNYFENQLNKSWKKFLLDEPSRKEDPSIEEIKERLNCLQKESTQSWNALIESITASNEQLFEIGLLSRITPTNLITLLQQNIEKCPLNNDQITLLGGTLVCWTLELQLERALHYAIHDKLADFVKEISNIPHSNWKPFEHVFWLILELEMNITIREIQIDVARHMMQTGMATNQTTIKNLVMQMNMGEGKTSVILPMLAASLALSDSSLVRIVVLKSLFPTNYQSLRCRLGGLLNKRIFPFLCRRDMNFNGKQINHIYNRLKQDLHNCDVILTSPENILSFDLLTIGKCHRNEFDVGHCVLTVQRWLKSFTRDVLDESDEILHPKYQLIYTVGNQQNVDGGAECWNTIQTIPHLVKKHAVSISKHFTTNSSIEQVNNKFSQHDIQQFLIVRGLLSSEVLLVALKKRYRVNYGVTQNSSFHRLMAVSFRAKDVAADRTEFGHPDVALVLTQLSYCYSGLSDSQLIQCFDRLTEKETDPRSIYEQ
ncbi:unnamed protein product [Rotaria sp. Silwood2]|nr:unnamed protein product [Rotaria sp. Silwood2]